MTAREFRANLEMELAWRSKEFTFFKGQLNSISTEVEQDCYRKCLVLILYSHLEGYIKFALLLYVRYINELNLSRKDVVAGLMTAGMNQEFSAYENLDRKGKVFHNTLPEDTALHRFSRRVEFMERMDEFQGKTLEIDDRVVDTESNIRYIVLQKNLYKLGLPLDMFEQYRVVIDALVNRRNSLAHGDLRAGVREKDFSEWESQILTVMEKIKDMLYDYIIHEKYLKSNV